MKERKSEGNIGLGLNNSFLVHISSTGFTCEMPKARWGHFGVLHCVNAYDGAMITLGSEQGDTGPCMHFCSVGWDTEEARTRALIYSMSDDWSFKREKVRIFID